MTTRSGTPFKPMDSATERLPAEGPIAHAEGTPAEGPTTTGHALPELASFTEMVKILISDREHREREIAVERERMDRLREEERQRHTEESERRIRELVAHLQGSIAERTTTAPRQTEFIKLTRLGENDDVEAYLTTFERIMEVNEVGRERWPFQLAPQLTGKAQQAYAALNPDDAKDYDAVKTAILRRYNINDDTYRQRFRALKQESPRELMTRLQDLASRWTRETATHQELLVREQFLSVLPPDVKVAVMERQPKDCDEASQFAENYIQARATSISSAKSNRTPTTKCPKCGRHGHWARDCPRPRTTEARENGPRTGPETGPQRAGQLHKRPRDARPPLTDIQRVRCFACNEMGHYSSNCPKRSLYCGQPDPVAHSSSILRPNRAQRRGTVNGTYCPDIVVDTGATQTLVHKRLVTDEDILDTEVTIKCAHGDTVAYPLAAVKITLGGKDITTAAVSATLPTSALLGWDVPELMTYITGIPSPNQPKEKSAFATTRSQAAVPAQPETPPVAHDRTEVGPAETELDEGHQEPEIDGTLAAMDDALFTPEATPRPALPKEEEPTTAPGRLQYRRPRGTRTQHCGGRSQGPTGR